MGDEHDDDPASRVRGILMSGIAAIETRMAALTKGKADGKKTGQITALTKDAATILSHVRRYDQAMREATRNLSPAVVIAYLRALSPERRMAILSELGAAPDDDEQRSVLS